MDRQFLLSVCDVHLIDAGRGESQWWQMGYSYQEASFGAMLGECGM
jgi:hypothetical protein